MESTEELRMAMGAWEVAELSKQHAEDQRQCEQQHLQ